MRDWSPVLVGRKAAVNSLSLDGLEQCTLPVRSNPAARLTERLRERRWAPDAAAVRILRTLDVKLVHAHFGPDAVEIWPSVHAANLPLLVTLHGYDISIRREWWESGCGGPRMRAYPERLLKLARENEVQFIAVSSALKQRAIEYGIPATKLTVSHLGVDTEMFKPAEIPASARCRRILFVGRMVEKKAPLALIRAFADIKRELPDAELVMIGDGPLLDSARRLADSLAVSVSFTGPLTGEQVAQHLRQSAVFCLPSVIAENGDAEGLPISILEAQSSGIPVVTSAEGAADALSGELTGKGLFPAGNWRRLEAALLIMLTDTSTATAIAKEGRRLAVEHFDAARCTANLERIYNSAVAKIHE